MILPPIFPNSVWNGSTGSRSSRLTTRSPDEEDWDRLVAEVIALQNQLITTSSSLVIRTFILGNSSPVTVGNDKLNIIFVPGGTTATLQRIRIGAKISGNLTIRIKINGTSIGTFSLSGSYVLYDSLNLLFPSGQVISVDVTSVDGTVQNVTTDMEFLVA